MFKKILSCLVCAAVLSLAGCGKNETGGAGNTPTNSNSANNGTSNTVGGGQTQVIENPMPDIPVTDASAFEYKYDSDLGGMAVTNYLRESPKVRIPDTFEGEPVVKVDFSKLDKELTELIMPDSVKEFRLEGQSALKYVNVPQSTIRIGEFSLKDCKSLTSITIPAGVTDISSIYGCDSLASINVEDGNPIYFSANGMLCKKENGNVSTLYICPEGVTGSVTVPDSVDKIGNGAFMGCKNLTSVTIPGSVTEIGFMAFYGCEKLINATIDSGVTTIGAQAFENCTALMNVDIREGVTKIENLAFANCLVLESITIPNSVISISYSVFEGCTSLKNITMSDNITTIGNYVFKDCINLTNAAYKGKTYDYEHINMLYDAINLSASGGMLIEDGILKKVSSEFTEFVIPDGVTEIGTGAFGGCTILSSVTIPDSVTRIEDNAFYGCTSLKNVTFPDSVPYIGRYVFKNCTSLESITYPRGDYILAIGCFENCTSLTSITIPDSVTYLQSAFIGCTSLENITIPNSVTKFDLHTFDGCTKVKVTYRGKVYSYYQIESLYNTINRF